MAGRRWQQAAMSERDRLVLDCLRLRGRPMTAYELIDDLRGEGISAPPTIYRVLARLTASGAVHRLQTLNAYMACAHETHASVPVFAICESCRRVTEIADESVQEQLGRLAGSAGFSIQRAAVEVLGRCAACEPDQPREHPVSSRR
jgi:Fur family zinc uptake transcriptional regulator